MNPHRPELLVRPDPLDPRLTETVDGLDHEGRAISTKVSVERPLTLFLNGQEIVTMMTIGDYPDYLALGYLINQRMLLPDHEGTGNDSAAGAEGNVVRPARQHS